MHFSKDIIDNAKSWPFVEARKLIEKQSIKEKRYALFESGYGPSGLPHIGTFGEVARTTYVMRAFEELTGIKGKLFAFSDDMDGLRKVPDNIPNKDLVGRYLNFPLTSVPDPFECCPSFGEHNNNKLKEFLDSFNFEYEFQSATDWYRSGRYNEILQKVLENHQEILEVMLPSLREERASNYSPFLPVDAKTGKVLQTQIVEYKPSTGTIIYKDEEGKLVETEVINGKCKLQWKVDWAARWTVLGVDYEMAGKDLIDSVKLSSKICKILGGTPPEGFNYELFLDNEGKKISKSKGNGLSVDDWLKYGPIESLAHFMYSSPKSAKKLYFDVIPRQVDEYLSNLERYDKQADQAKIDNPVWHIDNHDPKQVNVPVSFSMLLNLAAVCNTDDPKVLWGFIAKYKENASPSTMPFMDKLVHHAIAYYNDFIKDYKEYKTLSESEKAVFEKLLDSLNALSANATSEDIQTCVYNIGNEFFPNQLKSWFGLIYEALFGQKEGPRIGSFAELYGLDNFKALIKTALSVEKA